MRSGVIGLLAVVGLVLTGCGSKAFDPPPSVDSSAVVAPKPSDVAKARETAELADQWVRDVKASKDKECPPGQPIPPGKEEVCGAVKPRPGSAVAELNEAARQCHVRVNEYNALAKRADAGHEQIVPGQTANKTKGGTITCAG